MDSYYSTSTTNQPTTRRVGPTVDLRRQVFTSSAVAARNDSSKTVQWVG